LAQYPLSPAVACRLVAILERAITVALRCFFRHHPLHGMFKVAYTPPLKSTEALLDEKVPLHPMNEIKSRKGSACRG
jgi:hypothetical protein